MSYCRWSSMNFACDIYAYESVGDFWQIHVAGNRTVGIEAIPKLPNWPGRDATPEARAEWPHAYATASKAQSEFLETAERVDIDLPFAGTSIQCATLEDFKAKLIELRNIGYLFPDGLIEEIDAEIAEGAGE